MAQLATFYLPEDEALLREVGRVVIRHSHLDHMLRLAIKRMLGISIDDPGYMTETRGMTGALRETVRELIADTYGADDVMVEGLHALLDRADVLSEHRNRLVHSVWMQTPGVEPRLNFREKNENGQYEHREYEVPTVDNLVYVEQEISSVLELLDRVTRALM